MFFIFLATIAWPFFFPVFGQDPFVVAPQAYQLQFENEQVRVIRVHYGPREKIPAHDHPLTETVYVYLSDSGPVRFRHTGKEKFTVDRPATRVGGFRLGHAARETHEVENLTGKPADFLRVELKTVSFDNQNFRGRFPPDSHPMDRNSQKVRFENDQIRIVRVTCAAQQTCEGLGSSPSPYLLIATTPAHCKPADESAPEVRMDRGQTLWVEAGKGLLWKNNGDSPAEFLLIQLKAKPVNMTNGQEKYQ